MLRWIGKNKAQAHHTFTFKVREKERGREREKERETEGERGRERATHIVEVVIELSTIMSRPGRVEYHCSRGCTDNKWLKRQTTEKHQPEP